MSRECTVTEINVLDNTDYRGQRGRTPTSVAAPTFLEKLAHQLQTKSFKPHPRFTSGHAQTFAGYYWPRASLKRAHRTDEARFFDIDQGVKLLAHCRWQKDRVSCPTILLVHGLEGSNASVYMLGTAEKAYHAGFNVVRMNLRNCGNTEHLASTLYHAGLVSDLEVVFRELCEQDGLRNIFVIGFSMGGNISLLFAGEDAANVPPELVGVCAVSPTIDLASCVDAIEWRENRLYKWSFLRSMKRRIRLKRKLFPALYDTKGIRQIRRIRDFDERYTRVAGGYASADDYYARASSGPVISQIRTPALIVHAQDDPFVPFHPFRDPSIAENPYVILQTPLHGGHVGFIGASENGEDRFWMENRLVEFCKLVHENSLSE